MDLINDLGTDLAFAFLVEKRFLQKIDSQDAIELIDRIRGLLESGRESGSDRRCVSESHSAAAH